MLGLRVHGDGRSVYSGRAGPSRGTGFLAVLTGLWTRTRGLLLDDLGTSPFGGEPLAVLAALVTSVLQVPVMTFFPGLLSGFLAYLYTWYCFSALLRTGCSRYHWKRFIHSLVNTCWTRYLQYRYLKQTDGLSPISLWTRSLPVVMVVIVSGSRWVLRCMGRERPKDSWVIDIPPLADAGVQSQSHLLVRLEQRSGTRGLGQ